MAAVYQLQSSSHLHILAETRANWAGIKVIHKTFQWLVSLNIRSSLLSYICVLNLCECELTDYFRECSHRNSIWFQRGTVSVQTLVSPGLFIIPGFLWNPLFPWSNAMRFVSHSLVNFFFQTRHFYFSRTSFLFPRVQRLNLIIALNLWRKKDLNKLLKIPIFDD